MPNAPSRLVTGLVALAVMACAGAEHRGAATDPSLLAGTTWRLFDLAGTPALANPEATLEFADTGRVAGRASCNRFFGSVRLDASSITFGALGATRMACVDEVNRQEAAYLGALQGAERFELTGDTLTIFTKGATVPLRFIRQAPAIAFRDPTGVWTITGHRAPGVSAMPPARADSLNGTLLQYGIAEAIAGVDTCVAPAYEHRTARADSLLSLDYRISAGALGLPSSPDSRIGVTQVSCNGTPWTGMGGTLLQVSDDRAFAVRDGVFFEVERRAP